VRARAARSRELVAKGRRPAVVARVLQVNRSGLYRTPKRPPKTTRRVVVDPVDWLIVEVAVANPTDGSRMVAALASRELGRQVNRKRAQRVMRQQRLLQRHRPLRRRRRPGFFRVERPDQLWHLDMTSVWVAEHGWCYLNAAIDCCTREIVGWSLELRCRTDEAIELVDAAAAARGIEPGILTLGTDNGSAFTSRRFRHRLGELGVTHRRGGYRDPESQAFIESWFGKLKERLVWRSEFETLDQARREIATYIESYHQRPHSGLRYRTPAEVRQTWDDGQRLLKSAA
jgi:putative transposase